MDNLKNILSMILFFFNINTMYAQNGGQHSIYLSQGRILWDASETSTEEITASMVGIEESALLNKFFQRSKAVFWLQPSLSLHEPGRLVMEFPYYLDAYEVWYKDGVSWTKIAEGDWNDPDKNTGLVLLPEEASTGNILIRIRDNYLSTLQIQLRSEINALQPDWYRNILQPGYFTIIMLFSLVGLFAGIFRRNRLFFLYSFFSFSLALFHLWDTGLSAKISMTLVPFLKSFEFTWKILPMLSGLWLSFEILQMQRFPFWGKFYTLSATSIIVFSNVLWHIGFFALATQVSYVVTLVMLVTNLKFAWDFKKIKPLTARFYLFGWAPPLFLSLFIVFRSVFHLTIAEEVLNTLFYITGLNQNIFLFFVFWEIHRNVSLELDTTQRTFSKFVPKEMFQLLDLNRVTKIRRGVAVSKQLTIFFSDIRSFTTLSEKLSPEGVFTLLNDYCEMVAQQVQKHNGILDKFIGDGVMALFPNGPDNAVICAEDIFLEMKQKKIPYRIGIGIHTGEVALGILGSIDRLSCTAVADGVNISSRVQDLNKTLGTDVLLTGDAWSHLTPDLQRDTRRIGMVGIRGKDSELSLYEFYGYKDESEKNTLERTKTRVEKALYCLQENIFETALSLFREALRIDPWDPVALYGMERCLDSMGSLESANHLRNLNLTPWVREWNNGVDTIDKQHQRFWTLLNQVLFSIQHHPSVEAFRKTITELETYAKGHFFYEELLMEKVGYHQLEQHRVFHKSFQTGLVERLKQSLENNETGYWAEAANSMSGWFHTHILGIDRDFVKHCFSDSCVFTKLKNAMQNDTSFITARQSELDSV